METRFLILGIMAAVAFASAATVAFFSWALLKSLYREPGPTFAKLFGPLLYGRTIYFCTGCREAHILPPPGKHEDGSPDWNANHDDGFFDRLVHEGQALLVLADRLAKRSERPLMHILVGLLTEDERDRALRALNTDGCDPIVAAMPGEPEREALRSALECSATDAWVSPFPLAHAEQYALVNGIGLDPALDVSEYVARLNRNEREALYAELALAEHMDKDSTPQMVGLMTRLAGLLEHASAGAPSSSGAIAGPAACAAASA